MIMISVPQFSTGPAIGDTFPDFTLRDQHNRQVNFTAMRGDSRAMIVVHRSARW